MLAQIAGSVAMQRLANVAPLSQIPDEAREVAVYIGEMAGELRLMAEGHQLEFVAYLLEMVVRAVEDETADGVAVRRTVGRRG
jgi:hypothetical protein